MRHGAALAALVHLVFAVGYLLSTPAFEAPDESDHYRYAFHIAHTGELPLVRGTAAQLGRPLVDEATQAYHPPAYYALLAATLHLLGRWDTTSSVERNPDFASDWEHPPAGMRLHYLHGYDEQPPVSPEIRLLWLLRGWSVLFGLVSVLATHRLGRLAFPGEPAVADMAALLLAVMPKWSAIHGAISNDVPAAALSHLVLVVLATALARRRLGAGPGLLCGLLAGLALMSKLTAVFLLPIMACVWISAWIGWPGKRRTVLSALLALSVLLLVTGFWFLRNRALYGSLLALDVHQLSFHERIRVEPGEAHEWIMEHFLPSVFASLLGHFGWWVLAPLDWLVQLGKLVALAAGVGWLLRAMRARARRREGPVAGAAAPAGRPLVVALLAGSALLLFGLTLNYNRMMRGPDVRYMFPALGPMAVLFAAGLHALVGSRTVPRALAALLGLLPVGIAASVLLFQFRPAFDPALARADVWHASLVGDLATPPAVPRLQLLEPSDGAVLDAPPRFCWTPAEDGADPAVYSLQIYREHGRVLVATHEFFRQQIRDTCWVMPPEAWAYIPVGEPLCWKVWRVPDRSRHETTDDVPGSAASRFTRRQ